MARAVAKELQGRAASPSSAAARQSSPSPDPAYIGAVMAVLKRSLTPTGSAQPVSTNRQLAQHVCWILSTAKGVLEALGDQHTAAMLQACILAACNWHATKVLALDLTMLLNPPC